MRPLKEWIKIPFKNSKSPEKILFRVDAGNEYGLSFGHLSRCLILSRVFKELYHSDSLFLMKALKDGIQYASSSGVKVKELSVKDEEYILNIVDDYQPDCLIVDLPYLDIDMSLYTELKSDKRKLFYIDDNRYINPQADVYLNSSILAQKKVKKTNPDKTFYFLGPKYFIFDDSLIENSNPIPQNECFNIVLSFGGSDPTDLMYKVVTNLINFKHPKIRFYIIFGPGYLNKNKIKHFVNGHNNFFIINNPVNIIPYFQSCDFVICAGGRTVYELLYLKKKFMPIASASHETIAISELLQNNVIQYGMKEWSTKEFLKIFESIIKKEYYHAYS